MKEKKKESKKKESTEIKIFNKDGSINQQQKENK